MILVKSTSAANNSVVRGYALLTAATYQAPRPVLKANPSFGLYCASATPTLATTPSAQACTAPRHSVAWWTQRPASHEHAHPQPANFRHLRRTPRATCGGNKDGPPLDSECGSAEHTAWPVSLWPTSCVFCGTWRAGERRGRRGGRAVGSMPRASEPSCTRSGSLSKFTKQKNVARVPTYLPIESRELTECHKLARFRTVGKSIGKPQPERLALSRNESREL